MNKPAPYLDENGDVRSLDETFFKTAKRGRPPMPQSQRKQRVNIMLDPDIIAKLKEDGRGWQTRANATLRKALGL